MLHKAADASIDLLKELEAAKANVSFSGHPLDAKILSTYQQLREFPESYVWQDILAYLDERSEIILNELMDEDDHIELIKYKQELKVITFFREIPMRLLIDLQSQVQEQTETEKSDA